MLFYKVLILFWGCTGTCSYFGGSKIALFSHNLHYNFLPSLTQRTRLFPGLMKAHLSKNEMCCDWLTVPMHFNWQTA